MQSIGELIGELMVSLAGVGVSARSPLHSYQAISALSRHTLARRLHSHALTLIKAGAVAFECIDRGERIVESRWREECTYRSKTQQAKPALACAVMERVRKASSPFSFY